MSHGGDVWQGGDPSRWQDHSANLRPEGMPDWVRRALETAVNNAAYYPQVSMERARHALSEFLDLKPDHALPTAGGISALDIVARSGMKELLVTAPCFSEYAYLARKNGIPVRSVSLLRERHCLDTSLEDLKKAVRPGATVCLCNPLNPVGIAFEKDVVLSLIETCEKQRATLVVDEAFIDYCPDRSVHGLIPEHPALIVTGSFTKVLSIPGVRLGYLCAHPDVMPQLHARQLTWELNCFAEQVLMELPAHRGDMLNDSEMNSRRRERMRRELEALGLFVYPSDAGFLLADMGTDAHRIAETVKEKNILVRECMDFEGICDGRHLRLAVRTEEENTRLVGALREAIVCAGNH